MNKKRVCVIGHTESTCNYITQQLLGFLSQYIEVTSWCTSLMQTPLVSYHNIDIFVLSNHSVYERIRARLPAEKPVLIADRIINAENLDKLFDLEPGSRTFVVGTTSETVINTIDILQRLGFRYFNFIPYYPGIAGELPLDVDIAITTGLAHLVPAHVKQIIDLGGKGLDLSTFAELLKELEVPATVLNDISHFYLESILNKTLRIRNIGKQIEMLKERLEVTLNTVDEAIVATDDKNKVVLFNPAAQKLLNLQPQTIGGDLKTVIPGIDLSDCLQTGEGVRQAIKQINKAYYVINANPVVDKRGQANGVVATVRPVQEVQELETKVRRVLKQKGNFAKYDFRDIIFHSQEMEQAVKLAKKFAQTELTILLEGESGTGKELFAQSVHNASPRAKGPFVAVNFAAIPENLIESELFGYEDGAFTGAKKGGKAGLFEEAHMGTIFLDEIGSASLDVQKRLLRVLEEHEVRRVGSSTVTPVNVRVVAAANHRLEELVRQGSFRSDLFYRLCALPIIIPPLRQRRQDILLLAEFFAEKYYRRKLTLDDKLASFLVNYDWPGNVRELQNVVRYICNLAGVSEMATVTMLPQYLLRGDAAKLVEKTWCGSVSAASDNAPDIIRKPGSHQAIGASESRGCVDLTETKDMLSARLKNPADIAMAGYILAEIAQATAAGSGIGWQALVKRLNGRAAVSENIIKRWLKKLTELGLTKAGVTRQGTKITEQGLKLLRQIQIEQGIAD